MRSQKEVRGTNNEDMCVMNRTMFGNLLLHTSL